MGRLLLAFVCLWVAVAAEAVATINQEGFNGSTYLDAISEFLSSLMAAFADPMEAWGWTMDVEALVNATNATNATDVN